MNRLKLLGYLLLFSALGFFSCEKLGLCKDDDLQMVRVDYTGNQLNTQGFYFGDTTSTLATLSVFYRNGIFLGGGPIGLQNAISGILPPINNDLLKQHKSNWGVYKIEGNDIEIEYWESGLCGVTTVYEQGTIVNDTTYIITLRQFRVDGRATKTEELESTFHFRPSAIKPDSSVTFIQ